MNRNSCRGIKGLTIVLLTLCAFAGSAQRIPVGNSMDFVIPYPPVGYNNDMIIYICTGARPASIIVTTYSDAVTSTTANYTIAANSALGLPPVPKNLLVADQKTDVVYKRTVSIHSDVPVTAYAYYPSSQASGGTTLIPVRSWGYSYDIMDVPNDYAGYVCVTAAYDSTVVEITPTQLTFSGHPAGAPFVIRLNKGEVYQFRIPYTSGEDVLEITGTVIKAIPNSFGISYPIGVYSGAGGLSIKSDVMNIGAADFEVEQMVPECRWGKFFLTVPFSASTSGPLNIANPTWFRIMVKDPATVVRKNGVVLTGLINNLYYEYVSQDADYIEADQPVMMTQNMFTINEINYPQAGSGDGEMIAISPVEDAGTRADLFLPKRMELEVSFVSLTIPTIGLPSLTINGSNAFSYTYQHPNKPDYTVVINKMPALDQYCTVQSSVPFNGLSYGLPVRKDIAESNGFNISPVFYPEGDAMISIKNDNNRMTSFVCAEDSFRLILKTEYMPVKVEWQVKNYPGLLPASDNIIIQNPVPDSTISANGHTYFYFSYPQFYSSKVAGNYAIPVVVSTPVIKNCSATQTFIAAFYVGQLPMPDFTFTNPGCLPFNPVFTAITVPGDTSVIAAWHWNFGVNDDAYTPVVNRSYTATGDYSIYLHMTARNGCFADTTKVIKLIEAPKPGVAFSMPSLICMPGSEAAFKDKSTYTGTAGNTFIYKWQFGDNTGSSEKDPVHIYQSGQNYPVKLIVAAADGCTDSLTQTLSSFVNKPFAIFDISGTEFCLGEEVVLTNRSTYPAGSSIATYNWILGDGSTTGDQSPVKKYNTPGSYTITLSVTGKEGCKSDVPAENTIQVYDVPKVEAGRSQDILSGATVQLEGKVTASEAFTIEWTPAIYLSAADIEKPVATPPVDQLFYLTASNAHCSAYDSVLIKVLPSLKIPNAFSPNGDGINDSWVIPGLNSYPNSTVLIFDRWGRKVFESKGYPAPWTGTYNGSILPSGTYYYIINPNSLRPRSTGTVTILR